MRNRHVCVPDRQTDRLERRMHEVLGLLPATREELEDKPGALTFLIFVILDTTGKLHTSQV